MTELYKPLSVLSGVLLVVAAGASDAQAQRVASRTVEAVPASVAETLVEQAMWNAQYAPHPVQEEQLMTAVVGALLIDALAASANDAPGAGAVGRAPQGTYPAPAPKAAPWRNPDLARYEPAVASGADYRPAAPTNGATYSRGVSDLAETASPASANRVLRPAVKAGRPFNNSDEMAGTVYADRTYQRPDAARAAVYHTADSDGAAGTTSATVTAANPDYTYRPAAAASATPWQATSAGHAAANSDRTCETYRSTAVVDGVLRETSGLACLQPDGRWRLMN